jgi:dTMP kinase
MLAARAAFVREIVEPTLERGAVMLADRFDYSTFAYQGFGRGLDLHEIRRLNSFATGGLRPDLVIILDLSAGEGRARQRDSGKSEDRIESSGESFLERVAEGYRSLADHDPHAILIEAMASPEAVHATIRDALTDRFPELLASGRGSKNPDIPLP